MTATPYSTMGRFDAKLEAMQSKILRTVGTWLFASQAAVITAIGVFTSLG